MLTEICGPYYGGTGFRRIRFRLIRFWGRMSRRRRLAKSRRLR